MVGTVEVLGLLDCRDIGRLLHDAHEPLIPSWTAAIYARIDVGNVVTHRAQPETGFDVAHGSSERLGVFLARAQDMESKALCTLAAHSWQLLQFIDEACHRLSKPGHKIS